MLNNTALKNEGLRILAERLGLVEAERFIVLMRRELFDYTNWRQDLFKEIPLDTFLKNAQEYRERHLERTG